MSFNKNQSVTRLLNWLMLTLSMMLLVSCGGGGTDHTGAIGNNSLAKRALPSVYNNVMAINYSGYRACQAPIGNQDPGCAAGASQTATDPSLVPTTAQILQDLTLINSAGYNLVRVFSADPMIQRVLTVAQQNFPNMKFHLGINLVGVAITQNNEPDCMTPNGYNLTQAITVANNFSNVVSVSVGNETTFFRQYMPISCLSSYITLVKKNVAQAVTTDEVLQFFLDSSANGYASILGLLDFVSVHI